MKKGAIVDRPSGCAVRDGWLAVAQATGARAAADRWWQQLGHWRLVGLVLGLGDGGSNSSVPPPPLDTCQTTAQLLMREISGFVRGGDASSHSISLVVGDLDALSTLR